MLHAATIGPVNTVGRMAYYYSPDLDKALVNAGEDL